MLSYSHADAQLQLVMKTEDIASQVKVDVKDVGDLSKLIKYCKLTLLQTELDQAFKKADSFGENIDTR